MLVVSDPLCRLVLKGYYRVCSREQRHGLVLTMVARLEPSHIIAETRHSRTG